MPLVNEASKSQKESQKRNLEPATKEVAKKAAASAGDFAKQEAALKPQGEKKAGVAAEKKEAVAAKKEAVAAVKKEAGSAEKQAGASEKKAGAAPEKKEAGAAEKQAGATEKKAGAGLEKKEAGAAKAAGELPESTAALFESPEVAVAAVGSYAGKDMPKGVAALLMAGIRAEGVSDATTLEAALRDYVDGGKVDLKSVKMGGATLKWLSFSAGDTEVGYMFEGSALKAIVSDGFINKV
jgi:hypothetical protein